MTPEEIAEKVVSDWGVWVHDVYLEQDELRSLIAQAIRDAYERAAEEAEACSLIGHAARAIVAERIRALKGEG